MFKIKINPIFKKITDLGKKIKTIENEPNNIEKMRSILFEMRILQGQLLKRLSDLTNKADINDNKKMYKISLLNSLLSPINSNIKYIEHKISLLEPNNDINNVIKFIDDTSSNNNSKPRYYYINTNDEISLNDIIYDNSFSNTYKENIDDNNQLSELTQTNTTSPDEATIDILKFNEQKGGSKNSIINNIKNIIGGNNTNNVDKKNDKNCIVLFYAPWCGWSKKFLPIWDEFKNKKNNYDELKDLKVVTINDSEKPEFSKKFGINGFPTVKFLKDNEAIDFTEERTVDNLINFAKKLIN